MDGVEHLSYSDVGPIWGLIMGAKFIFGGQNARRKLWPIWADARLSDEDTEEDSGLQSRRKLKQEQKQLQVGHEILEILGPWLPKHDPVSPW